MLIYSLKKIKEKKPPPYSVLNPETNSDSPSAKSKGERFDSAIMEHIQIQKIYNMLIIKKNKEEK